MNATATTAAIKVAGVTRTVTLDVHPTVAYVSGVVATIGRGAARYPATMRLWLVSDDAPRGTHGNRQTATQIVTDSAGTEWSVSLSTNVRNRQARVVAWADVAPATNEANQTRRA